MREKWRYVLEKSKPKSWRGSLRLKAGKISLLFGEPEALFFTRSIADASRKLMSAFNALETGIVVEARKGEAGGREFDLLIHRAQIEIVAMNADQTELARAAWRKHGKGNHPASLNIGDCCAYALAKYSGEPLLFKGSDFRQTDIQAAITL
ncbi:MAG: type II toxin-antitoxin system VapC family toxin [Desulfobacteraceae bacterium]|jgi:ribonuclease VapC|nr:type II toxin-antitoxin system VapC family toxin [Desulfobacteraceae bacterium]